MYLKTDFTLQYRAPIRQMTRGLVYVVTKVIRWEVSDYFKRCNLMTFLDDSLPAGAPVPFSNDWFAVAVLTASHDIMSHRTRGWS